MASDNDPNSLIISIVSLVISSLWPVIWAIHVRYRDKIQARQLKLSEVTTRYVKDGIQVPVYCADLSSFLNTKGPCCW